VTSPAVLVIVGSLAFGLAALVAFLIYVWVRYSPIVRRIFEEPPVFAPLRVAPEPGGEEVRFGTDDGIELAGTYFPTTAASRTGVVVFCPEFLGDRWSALPYADGLREVGFDLFTFDFRNHGDSGSDRSYQPLQWVSDLEVHDLRAALAYLRTRPDRDPAGVGVFGISRGGGTALVVAAGDPTIWGVATDGAFPTRGTMLAYILRWAEIYVGSKWAWRRMPMWMFTFVGWTGRVVSQWASGRSYPSLERAVARLAPRPWLMIHGEKDAYIGPEIALDLFGYAREPKEAWIVPGAKHNRCREADPAAYRDRLAGFFRAWAPRRSQPMVAEPAARPPTDAARREEAVAVPAAS
jgi:pimeloyl-ACP methyl ester carboxylesterase